MFKVRAKATFRNKVGLQLNEDIDTARGGVISRSDIILLYYKTVACLFFVVGEVIDKHHFLCSPLQASQALQAGFAI